MMRHAAKRTTIHEVLRIAMDLERRTMALYTAFVSHHAARPELQKFWLTMARHEAGHFGALALVAADAGDDGVLAVPATAVGASADTRDFSAREPGERGGDQCDGEDDS